MSKEVRTVWTTGGTIYGVVFRKSDAEVWYPTGEDFETWGTGSRTANDYKSITMTEPASGSGYFYGDFPTDITTEAVYDVQLRRQTGATPLDSDQVVGILEVSWTGAAAVSSEDETVPITVTALCNYALAKVGGPGADAQDYRIQSVYDTTSRTAQICLDLQPIVRKEVLCRAEWSEALKFADLGAELSGVDKADFEYAFNLPNDYLGRCRQISEAYQRSTKPRYKFEYDKLISQGRLFTNEYSNEDDDSAYISYIFNLTDPTEFSPLLSEAIALKLAAELSTPLLSDAGRRRDVLLDEYERYVLPIAEGAMAMQDGDDEDQGEYTTISCRTN